MKLSNDRESNLWKKLKLIYTDPAAPTEATPTIENQFL